MINIKIKYRCASCDASGIVQHDLCYACKGTGWIHTTAWKKETPAISALAVINGTLVEE